ncbi:hypothetical protein D3C81_1588100 [compost metagenome]
MRITQPTRCGPRGQVIHRLVGQAGHLHIEQRHVDMLTDAGLIPMSEGRQNRHRRVQPSEDVGECYANLYRPRAFLTLRPPGQAHQPAQPLDHEVIPRALGIWPRLAEAGDGAIDKLRVERFQALVIQPVRRQAAHLEVLDDDIRLGR